MLLNVFTACWTALLFDLQQKLLVLLLGHMPSPVAGLFSPRLQLGHRSIHFTATSPFGPMLPALTAASPEALNPDRSSHGGHSSDGCGRSLFEVGLLKATSAVQPVASTLFALPPSSTTGYFTAPPSTRALFSRLTPANVLLCLEVLLAGTYRVPFSFSLANV